MNVVSAAVQAAPRPREAASSSHGADADFARVLAGLDALDRGTRTTAQAPADPARAAEGDAPSVGEQAAATAQAAALLSCQPALGAAALPAPAAGAADVGGAPLPAPPVAGPPSAGHDAAGATPAAPAAALTAPATPAPTAPAPATPAAGDAPAPALVVTGSVAPVVVDASAPTAAPDAVALDVPALRGDVPALDGEPAPVLDARVTTAPSAAAPLPVAAAPVSPETPADAATATEPVTATAEPALPSPPSATGSGAEAGLAAAPAPDLRAAGSAAAPTPAAPPPPAAQVVQLLTPVLAGPDGTYSLALQLYPEELGAVQVEVLLRGGEIRLALHAADEAAQAALRAALPDLRADLQASGLSATSLSVDGGRSEQPSSDRPPGRQSDRQPDRPPPPPRGFVAAEPSPRSPTSHADAALDLRM